jgi:hypothetical protein
MELLVEEPRVTEVAALLERDWHEMLAREGLTDAVAADGGACPACGCAEPPVAGECPGCGLRLA